MEMQMLNIVLVIAIILEREWLKIKQRHSNGT